jgi:hypothetical protein
MQITHKSEIDLEFEWRELINCKNDEPIWGYYDKSKRTITLVLGTFGKQHSIYREGYFLWLPYLGLSVSNIQWEEKFEKCREYHRRGNQKNKVIVLTHYSDSPPKCACCGETELCFLSIDHINGGGNKERKKIRGNFYSWFIKNNFPKGYQVLCMNCQFGRKCNNGVCPHKELKICK